MKYADLIEEGITKVSASEKPLALHPRGVDALNKSVPTLEELNEAFSEVE